MGSIQAPPRLYKALLALACVMAPALLAQEAHVPASTSHDEFLAKFQNPAASARPRIAWHWMNGNITEEGIKLDLEWMHRIGLGGVTIIQADSPTPQVVPSRLLSTSPEWKQAFTYALKTAKDLGFEVAPSGSPAVDETAIPSIPTASDDAQTRSSEDKPALGPDTPAAESMPQAAPLADLRSAASDAHISGRKIVTAEIEIPSSPPWSFSPGSLKKDADLEFALGVNRLQIEGSAHQPVPDMAPGLTLGPLGPGFNRNDTWAEEAAPWIDYLARCSYLLQQGHSVADVAYFYDEEGPLKTAFGDSAPQDVPSGYAYDFVNSDAILNQLSIQNSRWLSSGGTTYRILYLGGPSPQMSLPVLRKLRDLVAQGGNLVGNPPTESPSSDDDTSEFQHIVAQLWTVKKTDRIKRSRIVKHMVRRVQGEVLSGMTPEEALASLDTPKDFDYAKTAPDTNLMFVHRALPNGDLYFIDSRSAELQDLTASFRVEGKAPELLDPATGTSQPVSYDIADHRTTVPLHLEPWGSTFILFRKTAQAPSLQLPERRQVPLAPLDESLNHNWSVNFQSGRGAPESAAFPDLISWSDHSDPGIKYFSGTATYVKNLQLPDSALTPGARLALDLGTVHEIAEVAVNGRYFGILWKPPYQVDITSALQPGANRIVIQVTNLWVNRLIGDQQSWALKKYAFTDSAPYKADSPLLPSGLLGPVQILSTTAP